MADVARTVSVLDGYFKKIYLDKKDIRNVIPDNIRIQADIPYSTKNKMGKNLSFPVMFTLEQGFTHGAADEDILTYNDVQSATSQEATVDAQQIMLKSLLSFKAASRSQSSEGAFENETKHLVANMVTSFKKRVEILMFYGRDGLGTIEAKVDDGSTVTLTLTKGSFAPWIWAGMENLRVDAILANRSGFSHATGRNVKVKAVDVDNRKVTLDADIEAVLNVGDHLYFAKTSEDAAASFVSAGIREMLGMKAILTTSGTLFGISNTNLSLWRGTQYDAGTDAILTFEIIQKAVAKGVSKGLEGAVKVYVSHLQWADIMNDLSALKRADASYSKKTAENGAESIQFYSQNGSIEVIPNGNVKGGDAFVIKTDDWERCGSQEMTFNVPGRESEIFVPLTDKSAYMLAIYSDQVLFCKKPAAQVYIKDLSYND